MAQCCCRSFWNQGLLQHLGRADVVLPLVCMGVLQQFLLDGIFSPTEIFPASDSICNTSDCGFWIAWQVLKFPASLELNFLICPLLIANHLGFVLALCFNINGVFCYLQYIGQCRRNYAVQFHALITHHWLLAAARSYGHVRSSGVILHGFTWICMDYLHG